MRAQLPEPRGRRPRIERERREQPQALERVEEAEPAVRRPMSEPAAALARAEEVVRAVP